MNIRCCQMGIERCSVYIDALGTALQEVEMRNAEVKGNNERKGKETKKRQLEKTKLVSMRFFGHEEEGGIEKNDETEFFLRKRMRRREGNKDF